MTSDLRSAPADAGSSGARKNVEDVLPLLANQHVLVLFSGLMPLLRRLGLGKLPGDLDFSLFGRRWSIPLMSTILLSLLAMALARLL